MRWNQSVKLFVSILVIALGGVGVAAPVSGASLPATEEFVGALPGWKNLRTDFGAVGDGKADDTEALQKALNALPEHGKGKSDDPRVLYLPAGTYRITQPLYWEKRMGVMVLGEHPDRTRVVYDGPADQPILLCNGVSYSKFGRITWDGQGKASVGVAHRWDTKTGPAVTYMEHADEVFQDVKRGLVGGRTVPMLDKDGKITWYNHGMDAETLVKRCKFIRCSEAGLSIESFNALDWWIWDSEFTDCGVGATNCAPGEYGGGHFHIYRSIFRNSKIADIRTGHASYFGIRMNTSIGSRRFLETMRPTGYGHIPGWSAEDTYGGKHALVGNRIIHPTDPTPILLDQHGPLMMLDNTFVQRAATDSSAPVVRVAPPTDGAMCLSVGNRFTGSSRIEVKGQLIQAEDQTIDPAKTDVSVPAMLPTPEVTQRRIFALNSSAKTAEIQKALDEAATMVGQRPVVYLQAGRYAIDNTLRIPAGTDLQLIGDGPESTLIWEGEPGGTMLHITGPTRATLRDFSIAGIWSKNKTSLDRGIVVESVDQPGGHILLDQANVTNSVKRGLVFEGLKHTRVEAIGSGAGGTAEGAGITVDGGSGDASVNPWIGFFGSAGSNNRQTHLITNGGNLMVWDTWYETAVSTKDAEPRYIHLTDRGNLTFFNGHIATLPGKEARRDLFTIDLDGSRGNVAIIGTTMHTLNPQVRLAGDGKNMRFLALGVNFDEHEPALENQASGAQAAAVLCQQNQKNAKPRPFSLGEGSASSQQFLLQMLAPARTVQPTFAPPAPHGATDLRLYRVMVRYKVGEGIIFRN